MTDLRLEIDEEIILQSTEVERYGSIEVSLDEMVLTNKNIICVYNKSTGLFSKPDIHPLFVINVFDLYLCVQQVLPVSFSYWFLFFVFGNQLF